MKALTLTQPWASLVAIGAKHVETRSWRTNYRGPIAIHAAKGFPDSARILCRQQPFDRALQGKAIFSSSYDLPVGAVLAIAKIVGCIPTEQARRSISVQEWRFGDYTDGRWAWVLLDIEPLPVPVLAKGALGLWEWVPPWTLTLPKKDA